mgnify:CR=1 FL=1
MDILLWLWLYGEQKVSNNNIIRLHKEYGLENVFRMKGEEVSKIPYLSDLEKQIILKKDLTKAQKLAGHLKEKGILAISFDDENYPKNLKVISDPPAVLFYRGDICVLNKMLCVTFVGARNATSYGMNVAREFAAFLAGYGILIVSGAAVGIDASSHKGALVSGGKTAAVLGCGIDVGYPKENQDLLLEIEKNGVVISEFLPGTQPLGRNFPYRNRILAGLSEAVCVIEAGYKSGALNTVHHALNYGKEVYACPGDINKTRSAGTNLLIRDGAKMLLSANDILEDLIDNFPDYFIKKDEDDIINLFSSNNNITKANPKPNSGALVAAERTTFSENEQKVLGCLSKEPVTVDDIINMTQLNAGVVNGILTLMELKGIVKSLPGKKYVLK